MNGEPFMAPTIADAFRSFGVSHTSSAQGFVPRSGLMTIDFITTDFATGTASKLYRFHYNLCAAIPVNWPVMRQITGNQMLDLFRQWNRLNEDSP
jgi:hypothetical protein